MITLLSDMGTKSTDVACVKAKLWHIGLPIFDLTHQIEAHDKIEAAYLLKNSFLHFPENTLHLAWIDHADTLLYCYYQNHHFLAGNNGLLTLLGQVNEKNALVLPLETEEKKFAFLHALPHWAEKIITAEKTIIDYALPKPIVQLNLPKAYKTGNTWKAEIIYIDHYGNLVSNLHKNDIIEHLNQPFTISLRHIAKIKQITTHAHENHAGELFAIFNSAGYLEIGITGANGAKNGASLLLNAKRGDRISFQVEGVAYHPLLLESPAEGRLKRT